VAELFHALPVATLPALIGVALTQGPDLAARMAQGGVVGCGIVAIFGVVFEHGTRRSGRWRALAWSAATPPLVFALTHWMRPSLVEVLFLSLAACALALARLPDRLIPNGPISAGKRRTMEPFVVAGAIGAAVLALGVEVGPLLACLWAMSPIVRSAPLARECPSAGPSPVARFLQGYLLGISARVVFHASFAAMVTRSGLGVALPVAVLLACCCLAWLNGRLRRAPLASCSIAKRSPTTH